MKKPTNNILSVRTALALGATLLALPLTSAFNAAQADPPRWAPAKGHRRKNDNSWGHTNRRRSDWSRYDRNDRNRRTDWTRYKDRDRDRYDRDRDHRDRDHQGPRPPHAPQPPRDPRGPRGSHDSRPPRP